jgi:hypothetical protein
MPGGLDPGFVLGMLIADGFSCTQTATPSKRNGAGGQGVRGLPPGVHPCEMKYPHRQGSEPGDRRRNPAVLVGGEAAPPMIYPGPGRDAQLRERCLSLTQRAVGGWVSEPGSALALVLLLDQIPQTPQHPGATLQLD